MKPEQAKEILLLSRLGAAADDDPLMAEALDFANQNEELRRWLNEHLDAMEKIRNQFLAIPVPEGLREQILSEAPQMEKPQGFSLKRVAYACVLAAALVWLSALGYQSVAARWERYQDLRFDRYSQGMMRQATGLYYMDLQTSNLAGLRDYLVSRGCPGDYSLPAGFAQVTPTGCVASQWQGHLVSMICFRSPKQTNPQASDLWFFAAPRGFLREEPKEGSIQFSTQGGVAVAAWVSQKQVYLVGLLGSEQQLRALVQ